MSPSAVPENLSPKNLADPKKMLTFAGHYE